MDQKNADVHANSEAVRLKIFQKSLKFDLIQAIDGVINTLAHPLVLETLSAKEIEEFSNSVIKTVEESLKEIMAEIKERASEIIKVHQEQEKLMESLKKRGNRQFN